jgi:protein-L-isoaspartate(D-aspartate) O-methyltransferase
VGRLHQAFVDALAHRGGFSDPRVEAAFRAVPRHRFLPEVPVEEAYRDRVIVTKVEDGIPLSASSQPSFMAVMLEQLRLEPGHRVLEVGTGTGYNAALMAEVVGETGHVVTIDLDAEVVERARGCLRGTGHGAVDVVCGDGGLGHAAAAPYDRIIVTVGAWDIPPALREQLRPDGHLVIPLSINGPQRCIAFRLVGDVLTGVSMAECDFSTRLRGEFAGGDTRLRVDAEGRLWLWFDGERAADRAAIERWVSATGIDQHTGCAATVSEVFGGLYLWLALRDPRFVQLGSAGTARIPCLLGLPGKLALTAGLLDASGLCVLTPGETTPATTLADRRSVELSVRSVGEGRRLARELIELVRAWDEAGRPGTAGLRVSAYPRDGRHRPPAGAFVIDKRWSRLVLTWSPPSVRPSSARLT